MTTSGMIAWGDLVSSVQPRIQRTRSFDQGAEGGVLVTGEAPMVSWRDWRTGSTGDAR